jgi:hypothetical protein
MIKVKRIKNKKIKVTGLMATVPLIMAVECFQGTPEELAKKMSDVCDRVNYLMSKDKDLSDLLYDLCGPDRAGALCCGEMDINGDLEVNLEEF